jgi:HTH-type transcriptional repressor of NAD biosynthesis genes
VKKVCLVGSESTGKSTLTQDLAHYFKANYVPESAREIIGHTNECTWEHLMQIAELQAKAIMEKQRVANKLLFCDTDLNITKSYARFLFGQELKVEQWVEDANYFDLYLFLETDCPFVQDGTRLSEEERARLSHSHKQQLDNTGINYIVLTGNWEERFKLAIAAVKNLLIVHEEGGDPGS